MNDDLKFSLMGSVAGIIIAIIGFVILQVQKSTYVLVTFNDLLTAYSFMALGVGFAIICPIIYWKFK